MKSVGKQLQEARLAKNWTPELASRETKIKVDRLRDLEADDYSHFTSPAYARGFVRTYARSLGLDEYKILRQLDNKLPEDDTSNLMNAEAGVAYLPETAMPPRVAHRDYTGLYIVAALGCCVLVICIFVIVQAYRVGELPGYFEHGSSTASTTETPSVAPSVTPVGEGEAPPKATPVDPNDAANPPKAQPVNPAELAAETNAAPSSSAPPAASKTDAPPKALPVDPSELTNQTPSAQVPSTGAAPATNPTDANNPPRATAVDPSELTGLPPGPDAASTNGAPLTPPVAKPVTGTTVGIMAKSSARQSNSGPVVMPPAPNPNDPTGVPVAPIANQTAANAVNKILVLTASQDSFVRVTSLDLPDTEKPLYAATLHSGQSVAFDGRKFSINVGVPSAVNIKLDGHDQGPHSDRTQPETFIVESHKP